LQDVVEFCEHHEFKEPAKIPKPLPSAKLEEFLNDKYDVGFITKYTPEELVDLLLVANFINMQCLVDLSAAAIASKFKGKEPAKLLQEYGLDPKEFTPEVEEELKKENPWAIESAEQMMKQYEL